MKNFYVLCGASLGVVLLSVGLMSLAQASVPRVGNTLDDTSIVGTVSEIQAAKLERPSLDEDLEALAGREALYRERLLTDSELNKQEAIREARLRAASKSAARLAAKNAARAARLAPTRSAWHKESSPAGRIQGGKVIAKSKTHWVIPDATPTSSNRADGSTSPSQPQIIRQGKHVFILQ